MGALSNCLSQLIDFTQLLSQLETVSIFRDFKIPFRFLLSRAILSDFSLQREMASLLSVKQPSAESFLAYFLTKYSNDRELVLKFLTKLTKSSGLLSYEFRSKSDNCNIKHDISSSASSTWVLSWARGIALRFAIFKVTREQDNKSYLPPETQITIMFAHYNRITWTLAFDS